MLEASGVSDPQAKDRPLTDVLASSFNVTRLRWVLDEAGAALRHAYEAGHLPPNSSETIKKYLEPDGGAMKSLQLIEKLFELASKCDPVPSIGIFTAISAAFELEFDDFEAQKGPPW